MFLIETIIEYTTYQTSWCSLYEADGRRSGLSYSLSDSFFTSARLLNKNFLDNALRGLTRTPVQEVDQCFADDVTSKLFKYFYFVPLILPFKNSSKRTSS